MSKELGVFVVDERLVLVPFCPYRYYRKFVTNDYPWSPTEPMQNGLYFETRLIGGSAKGQALTTLKRKRNGEMTAVNKRIHTMVDRMGVYMAMNNVSFGPENTQSRLWAKHKYGVLLRGEMDIFPTTVNNHPAIVDIKTTVNVTNSFVSMKNIRLSSNFCYGNDKYLSKNQPLFYHFIARNYPDVGIDFHKMKNPDSSDQYDFLFSDKAHRWSNDDLSFYLFIAGIGTPKLDNQLKTIEYQWSTKRESLLDEVVEASMTRNDTAMIQSFKPSGHETLCGSCAFKDVCKSSVK